MPQGRQPDWLSAALPAAALPAEPWRWRALDAARALREGQLSSVELTRAVLARVDAVNPRVNALVSVQPEAALAAAAQADARLMAARQGAGGAQPPLPPLLGIPVSTKVNVDQQGLPTTNGVVAFKDLIATHDSPPVAHLRRDGAVLFGRSNTPAFSMRWHTENDLHGRTLNPFAADRTPGGSSGGAAAALAVGLGPIAHGNDGGGSIRYPAWCCGVVGLRPTFGRVAGFNPSAAVERPITMQMISVQGPLARSVADLRIALACLAQPDDRDPWWVPAPLQGPARPGPLRVALAIDPAGEGVHPSVRDALLRAAALLQAAGYEVESADPPDVVAAAEAWNDFAQHDARLTVADAVQRLGDQGARRSLALMLARVPEVDAAGRIQQLAARSSHLRRWQLFMARHPLVLCPTATEPPLPWGVDTAGPESMDRLFRSHRWLFATALLGLPSASVPTGLVHGLPTGVQIIGQRFREDEVLGAAEVVERGCTAITPMDPG